MADRKQGPKAHVYTIQNTANHYNHLSLAITHPKRPVFQHILKILNQITKFGAKSRKQPRLIS